jgi:hypothetical protein
MNAGLAEVHVIGAINDMTEANRLRDTQMRNAFAIVAAIAGFTGYMLGGIFCPVRKYQHELQNCRRSESAWAAIARSRAAEIDRRDAVRAAVKRIRRINKKYRRRLH